MKIKKQIIKWDEFNQSKWMRYEKEIIQYYYKRLNEWLEDGMKNPYFIAFTSGLGRDIAGLMARAYRKGEEDGLKIKMKKTKTIKTIVPHFKFKETDELKSIKKAITKLRLWW